MSGWEEGERKKEREGDRPSSKGQNLMGGNSGKKSFFKDTRNERKQEASRGLRVRKLKFKMEIYQSSN